MRMHTSLIALSLLGAAGLGLCLLDPSDVHATPVPAAKQVEPPAPTSELLLDGGVQEDKATATIVFATTPAATANVFWGRKLLGKITPGQPLVVVRPRDSGPLDVVIRASGYLAVQTRAHTFSDNRVQVKLTPPENMSELLGYRVPLDGGLPDGALDWDAQIDVDASAPPPTPMFGDGGYFQTVPSTPTQSPLFTQ